MLSCTHKGRGSPTHETLSAQVRERIEQERPRDYGELRIERMFSGRLSDDIHDFWCLAGDIRIEGIAWGGAAIQYLDTTSILNKSKPQL